ncbi:hypothetical protein ACFX2J_036648 [Malus domestica]
MSLCRLSSHIITFEHEENWSKALEYYGFWFQKFVSGRDSINISCLRALKEGDYNEFHGKLKYSKQELHDLFLALCVHVSRALKSISSAVCSYVSGAPQFVCHLLQVLDKDYMMSLVYNTIIDTTIQLTLSTSVVLLSYIVL